MLCKDLGAGDKSLPPDDCRAALPIVKQSSEANNAIELRVEKNLMRYLSMTEAVEAIVSGEVIAYPTETFFGVGGLALNEEAVRRVYEIKHRSASEALPVIIGHEDQLSLLAEQVPDEVVPLLRTLWPGPLNIIFTAKKEVPTALTAGLNKVAVRLTAHPAARELCLHCGPITASSANLAGEAPVTEAALLSSELLSACAGVLDVGPSPKGGQPSTLIEMLEPGVLRIVRPGAVSATVLSQMGWVLE